MSLVWTGRATAESPQISPQGRAGGQRSRRGIDRQERRRESASCDGRQRDGRLMRLDESRSPEARWSHCAETRGPDVRS